MNQEDRQELEDEKLMLDVRKLNAELQKLIEERAKLKLERMFYPFVTTGTIVTVVIAVLAFISNLHKY